MAAITPVTGSPHGRVIRLRNVSAQATTGQTDWIFVPNWASFAQVYFNLTANAGTTPISTPAFLAVPPNALDDANAAALFTGAAITAAGQHIYHIGPGVTGIANGTDATTGDAGGVGVNVILPDLLGVQILNDRGTADETYTYTLDILFRK